jgi:hypothetical protein
MGTAQSLVTDRRQGVRHRFSRRGGGLYLPLAERNALAIAGALVWVAISIVVSLPWIGDLASTLTMPVAIMVVAGIAILPGDLNAHLLVSLALDRPPPVQVDDTTLPPVTHRGKANALNVGLLVASTRSAPPATPTRCSCRMRCATPWRGWSARPRTPWRSPAR